MSKLSPSLGASRGSASCVARPRWPAAGKHCIFFETAMNLRNHKRHAVLECVPVGQREMDKAPGFFKKAMQVRTAFSLQGHHAGAHLFLSLRQSWGR
eukprot:1140582-Pelagomonas_calceolata.AAC.1